MKHNLSTEVYKLDSTIKIKKSQFSCVCCVHNFVSFVCPAATLKNIDPFHPLPIFLQIHIYNECSNVILKYVTSLLILVLISQDKQFFWKQECYELLFGPVKLLSWLSVFLRP
jgi:hypothetical protein